MATIVSVIDVGSNAIRMAIAKAKNGSYEVIYKRREPIRLGADVFSNGEISHSLLQKTIEAFKIFKKLSEKYNSSKIIAIGTSALRNAKNQKEVLTQIFDKSGIDIDVITGSRESELVYKAINHSINLKDSRSLLIDIGGGSVELVAVDKDKIIANQSFPLGTVRLINQLKLNKKDYYDQLHSLERYMTEAMNFIKKQDMRFDFAVGIGGNMERMSRVNAKLTKLKNPKKVPLTDIKSMYDILSSCAVGKRMKLFDLKSDQADVIIPAIVVTIYLMQTANTEFLYVPGVGIKDSLFLEEFKK